MLELSVLTAACEFVDVTRQQDALLALRHRMLTLELGNKIT